MTSKKPLELSITPAGDYEIRRGGERLAMYFRNVDGGYTVMARGMDGHDVVSRYADAQGLVERVLGEPIPPRSEATVEPGFHLPHYD